MSNKPQSTLINDNSTQTTNEQEFQDCLPCKITGGLTFGGVGAYLLKEANTLNKIPAKQRTAVGLGVGGVVFISAGIYRLIM